MVPLDDLMRAYWGQTLRDHSILPAGLSFAGPLHFPVAHPAVGKVIGATLDKIQVFSTVHPVASDREIARLITDEEYAGDLLFVLFQGGDQESTPSSLRIPLQTNERLDVPYEILRFDANTLQVRVNPAGGSSPGMVALLRGVGPELGSNRQWKCGRGEKGKFGLQGGAPRGRREPGPMSVALSFKESQLWIGEPEFSDVGGTDHGVDPRDRHGQGSPISAADEEAKPPGGDP